MGLRHKSRIILLAAIATLLPGCGHAIFERVAFAPAVRLSSAQNHCDYYRGTGYTCEQVGSREIFFPSLDEQIKLQALFFPNPQSDRIIVYFHGNGGHVYMRVPALIKMAQFANVFILSYRGYGKSQGKPSEVGVYQDARAAVRYVREQLGFTPDKTYLYGSSLGAAVAIEVAQDASFAGQILLAPFLSGRAMAEESGLEWVPGLGRPFDSVNKLPNITAPTLFIHGTEDAVVPYEQGYKLYQAFAGSKIFKSVEGAGHTGLSRHVGDEYWEWLRDFVV